MATPFSAIYEVFTNKISDYSFLSLTDSEIEDILGKYLISSTVRFSDCKASLSDRDVDGFNADLTDHEIEVLATLMIVEWLTNKVNTTELMSQRMSNKDFKIFSQAQHLKEVRDLRNEMREEANSLMSEYSWGNLDDLEDLNK